MSEAFADRTGLEPATSAVTGRHSNRLNYRSFFSWGCKCSVYFSNSAKDIFLLSYNPPYKIHNG
ncbi:MAG: hypothetical protein K0Q79_1632 [Flavipsychrobacter sp.]|nr:hypothetical protein [Flavipsychrobacter sp.]